MSTATRTSRRRRLLQEGIASQSSSTSNSSGSSDSGPKARFAPRPGSVSFALATALPRSLGGLFAVAFVVALPLAIAVALEALLNKSNLVASEFGQSTLLHAESTSSFAAWWSATTWLLLAAASLLVFGLRRRRMDDLRGGYRWWIVASLCCLIMSFNAVTHAHNLIASLIGSAVGWSPLEGNALWWLVPGVLLFGGLSLRLFFDLIDSRLGSLAAVISLVAISYGWLAAAQLVPIPTTEWAAPAAIAALAMLGGQTFALISMVCYVRRIVLETEGTVAPPVKTTPVSTASKSKAKTASTKSVSKQTSNSRTAATQETQRSQAQAPSEQKKTVWTDGADDNYGEDYDDQPKRKLSKAERKRLRKQKARRAA